MNTSNITPFPMSQLFLRVPIEPEQMAAIERVARNTGLGIDVLVETILEPIWTQFDGNEIEQRGLLKSSHDDDPGYEAWLLAMLPGRCAADREIMAAEADEMAETRWCVSPAAFRKEAHNV